MARVYRQLGRHSDGRQYDERALGLAGDAADPSGLRFTVKDYKGTQTVPVVYTGAVPDAYKVGRDIVIDGTLENGVLKAVPDTLVTKCPSKYTDEAPPTGAKT